jgi:hypothetical protein
MIASARLLTQVGSGDRNVEIRQSKKGYRPLGENLR